MSVPTKYHDVLRAIGLDPETTVLVLLNEIPPPDRPCVLCGTMEPTDRCFTFPVFGDAATRAAWEEVA